MKMKMTLPGKKKKKEEEEVLSNNASKSVQQQPREKRNGRRRRQPQADSTDAVATFLTRRFGLKGGVAWLGLLTFGVVSEQAKTRWERREEKGKHARSGERRAKDDEDKRRDVVRRNRRRRWGVRSTRVLVRRTRLGEKSGDERDRLRHEDKQPTHRVRLLEDETAAVLPRDVNESFSDDRYIARNGTRRVFETTSGDDGLTFTDGSYVAPNVRVRNRFPSLRKSPSRRRDDLASSPFPPFLPLLP